MSTTRSLGIALGQDAEAAVDSEGKSLATRFMEGSLVHSGAEKRTPLGLWKWLNHRHFLPLGPLHGSPQFGGIAAGSFSGENSGSVLAAVSACEADFDGTTVACGPVTLEDLDRLAASARQGLAALEVAAEPQILLLWRAR